jgi:adiponectin receptor
MVAHDNRPESELAGNVRQRYPSKASPVSEEGNEENGAVTLEEKLLLLWDDLPHWRRDNAYITSGYRQSKASYLHTFSSLGHLHNESVNIWSHLLGSLAALTGSVYLYTIVHPRYDSATDYDVLAFACFFAGAVLCLGMSATYHALTSHSEAVARWGNKLDYSGIVLLIVGSYVPTLYYGFFCHPTLMKLYLSVVSMARVHNHTRH